MEMASPVLKGLPSLHKSEIILAELQQQLCHVPPSYVRLHRSERGVFKNVMFIKYPHRSIAEDCKLILERFYLGARPLKVEFKKKSKPDPCLPVGGGGKISSTTTPRPLPSPQLSSLPHGSGAGGGGAAAAPLSSPPSPSPAFASSTSTSKRKCRRSATPPSPHAAAAAAAAVSDTPHLLEKLIRELRVSTEHEGVRLPRHDLRKEDLRVLKQLCQFYGMHLDFHSSDTVLTVKRDTSLRGSHTRVSNLTGNGGSTGWGGSHGNGFSGVKRVA